MPYRLFRTAKWRKLPATPGQKTFIAKRWVKVQTGDHSDDISQELRIEKMSRGEAANIITRLKHGAQVSNDLLPCSMYVQSTLYTETIH